MPQQHKHPQPTEAPKNNRLSYYASLDGLRGIGLVAMLLYHSDKQWIPGGFFAISMFFTLSGFLITSLLIHEFERTRHIDFAEFWSRRFRRLIPAALCGLILTALTARWFADPQQLSALRWDSLSALFYSSNLRFILLGNDYAAIFASPSLVQHFWSLSIEEQFYLTYPILAAAMFRIGGRWPLALVLTAATAASTLWMAILFAPDLPTSRLYFGTDTRAAEILVGALLALWHTGSPALSGLARTAANAIGMLGLASTLVFWFTVSEQTQWLWQGGFTAYALVSAATIIGGLQKGSPVDRLLSWGIFPWLGKLSYGVYLYHFIIFLALTEQNTGLGPLPLLTLRLAITFATASASYFLLEVPIREGRLFASTGRVKPPLVLIGSIAITSGVLIVATINPPSTTDLSPLLEAEQRTLSRNEDAPRILVVGDSVAFGIGKALQRWASATQHASVFNLARRGCGIARGGRLEDQYKRGGEICDNWPVAWSAKIETFQPDVILVLTGGWDLRAHQLPDWPQPRVIGDPTYNQWLRSEYEAALDLLTARGSSVLWLTTPCYRPLNKNQAETGLWDPERVTELNAIIRGLAAERSSDLQLVDLDRLACPDGQFTNDLGGISNFRPDGSHFSDEAADWVIQWLAPQLLAANPNRPGPTSSTQTEAGTDRSERRRVTDFHELLASQSKAGRDVFVLGDSLCEISPWVHMALGDRASNVCVSGVDSKWWADQIQVWSPYADDARYAIVVVGTNDIGNGVVDGYEANLNLIVGELVSNGVEVWLVHSPYIRSMSASDPDAAPPWMKQQDRSITELRAEFERERAIDRAICSANEAVHCGPDLLQLLDDDQYFTDGVHFSPSADRVVADAVAALIPQAAPSRARLVWLVLLMAALGLVGGVWLAGRKRAHS